MMIDDAMNVMYESCPCGCGMEVRISSDGDIYTKWLDKENFFDEEDEDIDIDENFLEDDDQ